MRLAKERAKEILSAISGQKLLVFGDLMLDEYIFGDVNRISPEAPVPIVRITGEKRVLGGAANVASNLKALGAEPLLVGTIGNDNAGRHLIELLSKLGVDDSGLVKNPSQPTIIKTRVIGQHQQMLRIDREEPGLPCAEVVEELQDRINKMIQNASAVIVSDYAKGTVGQQVINTIRELAKSRQIPWIVDPKPAHKDLYFGASAMTPNTKELSDLTAQPAKTDDETATAASSLIAELGLTGLLVTRSENGIALITPDSDRRTPCIIPTEAKEVFDVSGAGDTVIATFSVALAAKTDWLNAAMLANVAAGVVVGKIGTATTTPQEILDRL
ncbi:MAG: D-glycero-beta-D-manno-heptose-7-phosphate kinase [Holophagales bacterium]|jgi:D-beta-D-heptose 7-phosphate kinase/D-beta-D-heptose 1-phosphate adenosyltransferase|nr:D-glycero-beta-D-manno-heptose-7-phosphate kinase [Holophagales bacterium]